MANRDNGSSAGCIEVALAACGEDKTSLAAHSLRIRLQKISRKNGVTHCCFSIERCLYAFARHCPQWAISSNDRCATTGYSTVRRAEPIHNRGELQEQAG